MKTGLKQIVCRLLIVSLILLPFQAVQAGTIGAGQAVAATQSQADRAALMATVGRADVARQLQTMGIDPSVAQQRIAVMTDDEVRALSGNINLLPAGAKSNGWVWAVVIIVAVVIWYNWK